MLGRYIVWPALLVLFWTPLVTACVDQEQIDEAKQRVDEAKQRVGEALIGDPTQTPADVDSPTVAEAGPAATPETQFAPPDAITPPENRAPRRGAVRATAVARRATRVAEQRRRSALPAMSDPPDATETTETTETTGVTDTPGIESDLWSRRYGDGSDQSAIGPAVDSTGNVLVAGKFFGRVNFGGGNLLSAGEDDVFVAKFGPNGNHLWSKGFGDSQGQAAEVITNDDSGNVWLAGTFRGTIDLGGGDLGSAGEEDIFIVKFDRDGDHQWSRRFGGPARDSVGGPAIDADGNVFLAGDFKENTNFGGGNLGSSGGTDAFLAKFDNNGNHVWSKRFGDDSAQSATGALVDSKGDIVMTGHYQSSINFGGGNLVSNGSIDVFVVKFDTNGSHKWSKHFGDPAIELSTGAAMDDSDNVVLTGLFKETINFGGGNLVSLGGTDIYLAKLNSSGSHLWSKRFGDPSDQAAQGVAAGPAGNVVLAGSYEGNLNFGGGNLGSGGGIDAFLVLVDSDGNHRWSKNFGDSENQVATGVAVDSSGDVVVAGWFRGTVNLGGGQLSAADSQDVFLAKFSASGDSGS